MDGWNNGEWDEGQGGKKSRGGREKEEGENKGQISVDPGSGCTYVVSQITWIEITAALNFQVNSCKNTLRDVNPCESFPVDSRRDALHDATCTKAFVMEFPPDDSTTRVQDEKHSTPRTKWKLNNCGTSHRVKFNIMWLIDTTKKIKNKRVAAPLCTPGDSHK